MTTELQPIIQDAPTRMESGLMGTFTGTGSVTIVSIYPGLLFYQARTFGRPMYRLQPAARGSYTGLKVFDTVEWMNRPDPTDGKPTWIPGPIPAPITAHYLIQNWARSSLGNKSGHAPGVGIIAGDAPTSEELAGLRKMQDEMFHWYILDANGKHLKGETTEINEVHRMAAFEMLASGAEKLAWYPKTAFTEVKDCIACGRQIEVRALVCPECKTDLVDRYIKYNLDPNVDKAVREFMSKMNLGAGPKKGKEN